jgi:hypothetical protein
MLLGRKAVPLNSRPTCDICDQVDLLRANASRAQPKNRQGRVSQLTEVGRQIYALERSHPKCPKCGHYRGGTHFGQNYYREMCLPCTRKYAPSKAAHWG